MGSSKKHKEKDKDHREKEKKSKKRRSSPSGNGDVDHVDGDSIPARKHKKSKEKRRHSGSDDSDTPLAKSSKVSRNHHEAATSSRRSPSPTKEGGEGDVLSIEATNKLRLKLGLKPLTMESSKPPPPVRLPPPLLTEEMAEAELEEGEEVEDFDKETLARIKAERELENETYWKENEGQSEFVHAPPQNLGEVAKSEKIRDRIKAVREKRRIEEKLSGVKKLADDDDDDLDDAAKWVERSKKLAEQKAQAEKKAKEFEELDDEFGIGDLIESDYRKTKKKAYSAKDIKGMRVLHAPDRIEADVNVILTLKDKGVLDEDDDVLVNVNMVDDEMHEKNRTNRGLRSDLHGYNVYDDAEFDEMGVPKEKGLLSKYDEEIQGGAKKKAFTIGENLSDEVKKAQIRAKMEKTNKILENIESVGLKIASDFYTEDEMVMFKKPKKKVRKVVRKALKADDLLSLDESKQSKDKKDHGSRSKKKGDGTKEGAGENEEEIKIKQEPIDMEIDLDIDDLPPAPYVDVSDVTIEDEADLDFQRALNKARKIKQREKIVKPSIESIADVVKSVKKEHSDYDQTGSIFLHSTAEFCRTLGDLPNHNDGDDIYGDEEMDFENEEKIRIREEMERGTWNEVEIDETPIDIVPPRDFDVEDVPILELEPEVGAGMAGALKLAMKKGYLDHEKKKPSASNKMKYLESKNYCIEDKSFDEREEPRGHSRRDMYSGPVSDFKEKESYKPNVKLDYVDDDGKTITPKEAFRILSHKFHGKGSGKNKIDKKRRKFDQQKLMQNMNSSDTPLGTLELLQQRQKDSHSAYIILTGNKSAQQQSISKSKHH